MRQADGDVGTTARKRPIAAMAVAVQGSREQVAAATQRDKVRRRDDPAGEGEEPDRSASSSPLACTTRRNDGGILDTSVSTTLAAQCRRAAQLRSEAKAARLSAAAKHRDSTAMVAKIRIRLSAHESRLQARQERANALVAEQKRLDVNISRDETELQELRKQLAQWKQKFQFLV